MYKRQDGEKIFEFSKIELKVTANREDVQIGIDVDSKITGLKGEGSYLSLIHILSYFFLQDKKNRVSIDKMY